MSITFREDEKELTLKEEKLIQQLVYNADILLSLYRAMDIAAMRQQNPSKDFYLFMESISDFSNERVSLPDVLENLIDQGDRCLDCAQIKKDNLDV